MTLLGAPLFAVIGDERAARLRSARASISPVVAIEFFGLSETPVLVAIPLFTFAGFLLSAGQAPARLVRLSQALLGWLPGGLAIVSLVAVRVVHGVHRRVGRHDHRARCACCSRRLLRPATTSVSTSGLITASGSLGLLFAPSLPLILYGVVAEAPIDDLFVAGALPGILMVAAARRSTATGAIATFATSSSSAGRRVGGDLGGALGPAAADRRARRNLQRLFRRIGGRRGHGAVRGRSSSS